MLTFYPEVAGRASANCNRTVVRAACTEPNVQAGRPHHGVKAGFAVEAKREREL